MILNDAGQMIGTQWLALTERFTNVDLHEFIVMPNHFHGILQIVGTPVGAPLVGALRPVGDHTSDESRIGQPQGIAPTGFRNGTVATNKNVGDMLDAFKSITTVEYIRGIKNLGWQPFFSKLWQRNYYEHIIRNEQSYQTIANYIVNNPATWSDDTFHNAI